MDEYAHTQIHTNIFENNSGWIFQSCLNPTSIYPRLFPLIPKRKKKGTLWNINTEIPVFLRNVNGNVIICACDDDCQKKDIQKKIQKILLTFIITIQIFPHTSFSTQRHKHTTKEI